MSLNSADSIVFSHIESAAKPSHPSSPTQSKTGEVYAGIDHETGETQPADEPATITKSTDRPRTFAQVQAGAFAATPHTRNLTDHELAAMAARYRKKGTRRRPVAIVNETEKPVHYMPP